MQSNSCTGRRAASAGTRRSCSLYCRASSPTTRSCRSPPATRPLESGPPGVTAGRRCRHREPDGRAAAGRVRCSIRVGWSWAGPGCRPFTAPSWSMPRRSRCPPHPGVPLVVTVHDAAPALFPESFPGPGPPFPPPRAGGRRPPGRSGPHRQRGRRRRDRRPLGDPVGPDPGGAQRAWPGCRFDSGARQAVLGGPRPGRAAVRPLDRQSRAAEGSRNPGGGHGPVCSAGSAVGLGRATSSWSWPATPDG